MGRSSPAITRRHHRRRSETFLDLLLACFTTPRSQGLDRFDVELGGALAGGGGLANGPPEWRRAQASRPKLRGRGKSSRATVLLSWSGRSHCPRTRATLGEARLWSQSRRAQRRAPIVRFRRQARLFDGVGPLVFLSGACKDRELWTCWTSPSKGQVSLEPTKPP